MSKDRWMRYLVAAALVLLAGAVWALAEQTEVKVEVKNRGGQEITVDVNGVKEVIQLDDLAEGEERTFDVGDHQIVVRRVDDRLILGHDGEMMGDLKHGGEADEDFVWVTSGGDCDKMLFSDEEGAKHHVVIIKDVDGEIETIGAEGEPHIYKWKSGAGEPVIIKEGGPCMHEDVVTYRCEETGSVLVVKKDDALLDSYVDPVTGCVMQKVEAPQHRLKVIVEKKEKEGADSDD